MRVNGKHLALLGGLVVGIIFNLMLVILARLGLAFWDAAFIAITGIVLAGSVVLQIMIGRAGKEEV